MRWAPDVGAEALDAPGRMPRDEGGGGIREVGAEPLPAGRGTMLTGRGATVTGAGGATEASGSNADVALASFSSPIVSGAPSRSAR